MSEQLCAFLSSIQAISHENEESAILSLALQQASRSQDSISLHELIWAKVIDPNTVFTHFIANKRIRGWIDDEGVLRVNGEIYKGELMDLEFGDFDEPFHLLANAFLDKISFLLRDFLSGLCDAHQNGTRWEDGKLVIYLKTERDVQEIFKLHPFLMHDQIEITSERRAHITRYATKFDYEK